MTCMVNCVINEGHRDCIDCISKSEMYQTEALYQNIKLKPVTQQ